MSGPAAGRTHLVLVGATGMVGGYALRYALKHPAVERVIVIGRRTLGISHTKLNEILHPNFSDCSALAESLLHQDATIFCLGAYTGSVSDTEFHTITVDYTVEFARVLHASSHAVTAAALARELQVSERTIYRDLSELAAQGAPVQGEAGVGYMLRPGLFLPPLMLTEDETEAVLLGLRYVDQRGDDVLTKAAANAHAKILAVLPHEGQIAAILPITIPVQRPMVFRTIRCRLTRSGQRSERVGGLRSATSMARGIRLSVSFGPFYSASWTAHGS